MIDIKFSYNWNKKLDCHAFTTIRLYNPGKHFKGQSVRMLLNGNPIGEGLIHDVSTFYLSKINSFMAFIDTGYSVEETIGIIKKMYPKIDFTTTKMVMILIVKEEKKTADLFS